MKDKDILKEIKNDIDKNIPDVLAKIDLNKIDIKEELVFRPKPKRTFFSFKLLIPITSFVLIGVLVLALINTPPTIINDNIKVTNKDKYVADYTSQALELINIENSSLLQINQVRPNQYIDEFHKYLFLIKEQLNLINTEITILETSNKKLPYRMIVKNIDVLGNTNQYTIEYYEKREVDKDEIEKSMFGILRFGKEEFEFYAEQEIDADESELKIIVKNKAGFKIEIEKEVEKDEYSFEYIISYPNKKKTEVSFEVKKDKYELKIETDRQDFDYKIKKISQYQLEIIIDEFVFELKIDLRSNGYSYKFGNDDEKI